MAMNPTTTVTSTRRKEDGAVTTTITNSPRTRKITWKELKNHTAENDSWVAIHGKVYDVSQFVNIHPGGKTILSAYAGRNASDEFEAFHSPRIRGRLPALCIGTMVAETAPAEIPSTKDYRMLRKKLWEGGFFEANFSYYMWKDVLALVILMVGVYFVATGQSTHVRLGMGGLMVGLAIQQVAFVAHDSGHRGCGTHTSSHHHRQGLFGTRRGRGGISNSRTNWMGWFHGCVCFGVSMKMWTDEHSRHHAYTMRPGEDPQFNYLPIFLVSKKELTKFQGLSALERVIAKLLVPFQHITLIPISVVIGRFNLHIISLIYALKVKSMLDVMGLAMYFAWFGSLVSILPPQERFPFILIAYSTAGILHVQLTISHLATDSMTPDEDEKVQFFAHQCKTTRNIDSTWWNSWLHGGLEYQIEHHLFPQLPRHNLAKAKPMVEDLCKKHGIPYRSTSFFGAVRECLSDMHRLTHFMDDLAYPHEICCKLDLIVNQKKLW